MKPCIVIDTRENRPYSFTDRVETVNKALPAGDYSVQGAETQIAVERKSLDDYLSTIIHAQARFGRELSLLQRYPRAWIVVEGSLEEVLQGRYTSRAHPQAVLALTASLMTRYGVPVLFVGDRPSACALVEALLVQWATQQEGG
jgi:DNA excision repair protein ERCC-4